jgi:hypothetical protein
MNDKRSVMPYFKEQFSSISPLSKTVPNTIGFFWFFICKFLPNADKPQPKRKQKAHAKVVLCDTFAALCLCVPALPQARESFCFFANIEFVKDYFLLIGTSL